MQINGNYHPDFELVANKLASILPSNGKAGGAALTVYHYGEKVVDIWGGTINREKELWQEDTMALSFSTTKGVVSTALHILIDQGLADYEDPIAKHWPAFGQNGKETITIRQAMCHEAGLYNIIDHINTLEEFLDWEFVLERLEQASPTHKPGESNGYHGLNYGHLIGGLIEQITNKPFQQVIKDEISDPLQLDGLYIGIPSDQLHRCAKLITGNGKMTNSINKIEYMRPYKKKLLSRFARAVGFDPLEFKAALLPPAIRNIDFNSNEVTQAIIPAANGIFTARSIAKMYGLIANGGEVNGVRLLSQDRTSQMGRVQNRRRDRVLSLPMGWRLGYHTAFSGSRNIKRAFGHFGYGGSGGWCCTSSNIAIGLTLNSGVGTPTGDLRIVKISRAVAKCAERRSRVGDTLISV